MYFAFIMFSIVWKQLSHAQSGVWSGSRGADLASRYMLLLQSWMHFLRDPCAEKNLGQSRTDNVAPPVYQHQDSTTILTRLNFPIIPFVKKKKSNNEFEFQTLYFLNVLWQKMTTKLTPES